MFSNPGILRKSRTFSGTFSGIPKVLKSRPDLENHSRSRPDPVSHNIKNYTIIVQILNENTCRRIHCVDENIC